VQSIREGGDIGVPVLVSDDKVSRNAFLEFAGNVARSTSMRNAHMKTEQIAEVVED
jgi:ATP-binding protein involved in chromosome partitioning